MLTDLAPLKIKTLTVFESCDSEPEGYRIRQRWMDVIKKIGNKTIIKHILAQQVFILSELFLKL